ncbi:hypothetical protein BDZ94DRAFT_1327205 [Collybia nuda]|uniref:Uncharacterized protein n=1 Tax=Collybia nuda TaxID=64659 RepID=A0A9P5XSL2_9AGAR|nr:hypothetical protein BDZ94DRAFT_1327205 [Collybia nuda]
MSPPSSESDFNIYTLVSKFDIEILEEASYILWHIWRTLHPNYSKLQTCIDALSNDSGLYQALKHAHKQRAYDVVRNWDMFPALSIKDTTISFEIEEFLSQIQPAMVKLVSGEIYLPLWSPQPGSMTSTTAEHIKQLHIPFLKGKPSVLHDLGRFKEDPILASRISNIFMPNNHTFLVNTSGSGKSRLLFEGLCNFWGFYFTSLVDSSLLGSSDVQNSIRIYLPNSPQFRTTLPQPDSPQYEPALKINRDNAERIFGQIFLARLLIFDLFARIMNRTKKKDESLDLYKQRWLLLQLQPSLLHPQIWDVFDHLVGKLSKATNAFINANTKALLSRVRELCSCEGVDVDHFTAQSFCATNTPFFCVLDEAQYAATQHCSAFRSDHSKAQRPVLREIVRAWEGQSFGQGVFMVVAGTGISKEIVDQAMSSAIMKDSKYRWCSDTGAFDNIQIQRKYILKYLPPFLAHSTSGKRLLERMNYWLHGRHRFTAGFIAELLNSGFQRPHTLLNAYIQQFAQFEPTDALEFVRAEGIGPANISSRYKLDFHKLTKNNDMIATIHQITTHYLMRSTLPGSLGKDEAAYVEYGFARFTDADTSKVAVDEPLVLLAATRWTEEHYRSSYKFFAKQIHLHEPKSNGFENFIAFTLNLAFSERHRLDEIFTFSGTTPSWANEEAQLIGLYRTELNDIEEGSVRYSKFFGPSVALGINSKTIEQTSAWLEHRVHAPLCFPHISMGPDLLFILKLMDGSHIWVALQAKYSLGKNGALSRIFLRRAMRSVTPSQFFFDKEGKQFSPLTEPGLVDSTLNRLNALPHRRVDTGKYSLLRVIASFPAKTNLKRCLEEDPDNDGHPIASLNMNFIKRLTKKLSPVDFLELLEKPLIVTGKRKTYTESHKRTKKLKLN